MDAGPENAPAHPFPDGSIELGAVHAAGSLVVEHAHDLGRQRPAPLVRGFDPAGFPAFEIGAAADGGGADDGVGGDDLGEGGADLGRIGCGDLVQGEGNPQAHGVAGRLVEVPPADLAGGTEDGQIADGGRIDNF